MFIAQHDIVVRCIARPLLQPQIDVLGLRQQREITD
jgi:hypothetical protein